MSLQTPSKNILLQEGKYFWYFSLNSTYPDTNHFDTTCRLVIDFTLTFQPHNHDILRKFDANWMVIIETMPFELHV